MCERRSHCHLQSKMDYQYPSDFGRRRLKHHHHNHRHHCDKQFRSEPERTWTGERFHHGHPQSFNEFEKPNHHHHHQQICQPEQFKGHHHHCNQRFSPFKPFSNQEGCKFVRHHFHQQFPFQFEGCFHQQYWPFARQEKFERHHKHHFHQQFFPYGRLIKCPQFTQSETCERRHPPIKQFWNFNEPYQFEKRCECHPSCRQFRSFKPFGKNCQYERHHCNQQFSCNSFNQFPQFAKQKICKRHLHCVRFGYRSQFGQLEKHNHQFRTCPLFGPFQYHYKSSSPCRRNCPSILFSRRFCGSKCNEKSRIKRKMKQLGRYQIKHHFHHHKAHRFHYHRSHW